MAAANCWLPSGIKFSDIGREQAGLEPSKAPTGSLLSLLKTLYFFDVKIMSLPPGLNTKTNPAVPNAGPKPQACGWGAKEAAGGAAQSLAPPDSCWAPLRRQGGCVLQRPSLPFFTIKQDSTSRATSLPCPPGGSQEAEAYASSWGLWVSWYPLPYLPGIVPSSSGGSQRVKRLRPETQAVSTTVFLAWFGDKNNCCFLLSHNFHWGHLGQDWVKASRRSGNSVEANSGAVSTGHTLPSPLHSRGIRAASYSLQNWPSVAFTPLCLLHSAWPVDMVSPDSHHLSPLHPTPAMLRVAGRVR